MATADDPADESGVAEDRDDVDPEQLQRELAEIKGAMGLADQYPGRARLWLFAGLLIGAAALLAQATFFFSDALSGTAYTLIWNGFVVVAVVASWWMASRLPQATAPESAPSWRALFGSLVVFLSAAAGAVGRVAGQVGALDRGIAYFALSIATIGLALLLVGAVLVAYRVRRRDRLVFYAGGLWVLVYASVLPYFQILRWVGVGLFGVLFALYAVAAYVYLTRA
jgi:hypothetical protein